MWAGKGVCCTHWGKGRPGIRWRPHCTFAEGCVLIACGALRRCHHLFLAPFPTQLPPKQWYRTSPVLLTSHTSYSFPPPPCPSVFGLLLYLKHSLWRPPKATTYYIFVVFCCWICRPQNDGTASPHTHCPPHASSINPSVASSKYLLTLAIIVKRQPLKVPLSIFWRVAFLRPNQVNQPQRAQTQRTVPKMDSWGVTVPSVGAMANDAMDVQGKAGGG